jgi:hypothetical protein
MPRCCSGVEGFPVKRARGGGQAEAANRVASAWFSYGEPGVHAQGPRRAALRSIPGRAEPCPGSPAGRSSMLREIPDSPVGFREVYGFCQDSAYRGTNPRNRECGVRGLSPGGAQCCGRSRTALWASGKCMAFARTAHIEAPIPGTANAVSGASSRVELDAEAGPEPPAAFHSELVQEPLAKRASALARAWRVLSASGMPNSSANASERRKCAAAPSQSPSFPNSSPRL